MKKILFLMHHADSTYWFKKELIDSLINKGYQVHLAVPNVDSIRGRLDKSVFFYEIEIDRRGVNLLSDLNLYRKYKQIIKGINPSIIYTAAIKPNIYGNLAAKQYRIPVISNITGLGNAFQNRKSILFFIIKNLYKKAFKSVTKVFFENVESSEIFLTHNLIKKDKVVIVQGSGVNIEKFKPTINEKANDSITFLLIGRIMKEKGINEYVAASIKLSEKYGNINYMIMGMVEEKQLLEEICNNQIINYLGELDDPREEIFKADCIVLPSYHEGMANTLLEGAAMGKPLIASNISGCKEIIEEGITGFLCKPKDAEDLYLAMEKIILMTKAERFEMGEKGREKMVSEFDRSNVVKKYIEEAEKVINNN